MAHVRVYPAGWAVGDKVTSAQQNALDINITNCVDKRAGQTDIIASVLTLSGAGRVIGTYATGANADTTYLVSNPNATIDVPTLTADRIYTLSNTNAVAGDRIFILNRSSFYITVKNAAATTMIVLGSVIQQNGESAWAEFLFNGTAWTLCQSALRPSIDAVDITVSGNYVIPRGVTSLLLVGWGGGGGGGGGADGNTTGLEGKSGGGGGGGAVKAIRVLNGQTPGATIAVVIGAGGIGGSNGAAGLPGGDGGDTTFGSLVFRGAQGGDGGRKASRAVSVARFRAQGGMSVRNNAGLPLSNKTTYDDGGVGPYYDIGGSYTWPDTWMDDRPAQCGAHGFTSNAGYQFGTQRPCGGGSPTGPAGGNSGNHGNTSGGSHYGGGGGGGGGAGPNATGGQGGDGGHGNSAGTGGSGLPGFHAGAENGGGGGGGGSGGANGSTGGSAGNPGGNGTAGRLIVIPIR